MEKPQVLDSIGAESTENNGSLENNQIEEVEDTDSSIINNTDLKPEERIYVIATDKDTIDWKGFLYQLIHDENLDPWNIDLGILTKRYLSAVKQMKNVDFDITGKFLNIAVFSGTTVEKHILYGFRKFCLIFWLFSTLYLIFMIYKT